MAAPESPESREFRQVRHDVDDVDALLTDTQQAVQGNRELLGTLWGVQRRHGNRLEEIQQSLDLQGGRLDRVEDTQRKQGDRLDRIDTRLGGIEDTQQEILTLLRERPAE